MDLENIFCKHLETCIKHNNSIHFDDSFPYEELKSIGRC
jgi:hypothetical protein